MQRRSASSLRGFTLTELLVAVGVLIVVILATARIFGTVTKVTSAGEANADMLQTAQAIERQLRNDLARISTDGFFLIQGVEVENDVNGSGAPLLNSALPASAVIRCDQLVFMVEGQQSSMQYVGSDNLSAQGGNPQSVISRVYYGHGIQLRNAQPLTDPTPLGMDTGDPVLPWTFDNPTDGPGLSMQNWSTGAYVGDIVATQPSARDWTLARQAILLANDGGSGLFFNSPDKNSTTAIWAANISPNPMGANHDPGPLSSRFDIAASLLNDIRQTVTNNGLNTWPQARTQILRSIDVYPTSGGGNPLRYPRAEVRAPSLDRIDQMLTNVTLTGQCSSFIVEWTYAERTGRIASTVQSTYGQTVDPTPSSPSSGDEWVGMVVRGDAEQPWFGLPDADRGVLPLSNAYQYDGMCSGPWGCVGLPIYPSNIEGALASGGPPNINGYPLFSPQSGVRVYQATFGYNRNTAVDLNPATGFVEPFPALGYTPWPTAIRITMTLHDSKQRFTEGRTFQFVIELPRR